MDQGFHTTRWSVVLSAAGQDAERTREALAVLCETYWYPLYAHARRKAADPPAAEDLVQDFFATLIEKDWVAAADPQRGRFRAFLLTAFNRHLGRLRDEARAARRGGGRLTLSLSAEDGERLYALEPAHDQTPERAFDRRWAFTLLRRAREELERSMQAAGQGEQFDVLGPYLGGSVSSLPSHQAAAAQLDMKPGAVKVAIHRLRRRYRDVLRSLISQTLEHPADVDDELRHLLDAIAG